jgi:hypothetical protein
MSDQSRKVTFIHKMLFWKNVSPPHQLLFGIKIFILSLLNLFWGARSALHYQILVPREMRSRTKFQKLKTGCWLTLKNIPWHWHFIRNSLTLQERDICVNNYRINGTNLVTSVVLAYK